MTGKIADKALEARTLDIPPTMNLPSTAATFGQARSAAPRPEARSLLTGKIIVGDGRESHGCVVRNLSAKAQPRCAWLAP